MAPWKGEHFMTIEDRHREGLERYLHGMPPGHFLRAVLENDLFEAVGRADEGSAGAIPAICRYIYNNMPANCWGSKVAVDAWLAPQGRRT